jgi:hypothetical protein
LNTFKNECKLKIKLEIIMGGFGDFMAGGAGLGAIGDNLGLTELLFGKEAEQGQFSTMTPQQEQLLQMLTEGLGDAGPEMMNYLREMLSGDSQSFENFSAPMMRQFEEETIPGIAERFGGMGAQSSSGFQQSLGKAGAGLQENLAALKSQLQMQASGKISGLMGQGLGTKAFENYYMPAQPGMIQGMAQGIGQGMGKAGTSAMMA